MHFSGNTFKNDPNVFPIDVCTRMDMECTIIDFRCQIILQDIKIPKALGKKRTQKGNEIVFDRGNYGIAVDVYL